MNDSILVIEDDTDIAQMIVFNLQKQGYVVHHRDSAESAAELLRTQADIKAIILDIMLPGMSGLDFCQQLRQQNHPAYVLMLTSLASDTDRIVGLELGADDYLAKPFNMRELQARIKALLRRSQYHAQATPANSAIDPSSPDSSAPDGLTSKYHQNKEATDQPTLHHGNLTINAEQRLTLVKDKSIALTAKEFDLLYYMASHAGRVYTREDLLQKIWGYGYAGYEHTVNTHINRLRTKLKHQGSDQSGPCIETVWGVGYKFTAQV